jgi:phenylalanyl-tRNA synthetase beta chain
MQFSESWLRTLRRSQALERGTRPSADHGRPRGRGGRTRRARVSTSSCRPGARVVKHPDADKLKLCKVDVGSGEPLQIVCGAPNVAAGMKVPCALVGAKLPGDFEIKKAKVRGIESFGMLCSARELGMSEEALRPAVAARRCAGRQTSATTSISTTTCSRSS